MKRLFIVLSAAVSLIVSCGPSQYAVNVEMRYPSKSGLELAGKSIAVAYIGSDDPLSTIFTKSMADGFAYSLEQKYALGDGSVGICRIDTDGGNHSSRDSLISVLLDVGSDVLFLFDPVTVSGIGSNVSVPFSVRLHCYDSMNKEDRVFSFGGSSVANLTEDVTGSLEKEGWNAGKTISDPFESQWKHEQYSILFFETEKWYRALEHAEQYRWKDAVEIWISLLDTRDMLKRACAEYNIAVAAYMSGDMELALKWLDRSDTDNPLSLSDGLRRRIKARM